MKPLLSIFISLVITATWAQAQSGWRPLGTGSSAFDAPDGVYGLAVDKNHDLYASGGQDTSGYYVAKWSGTSWQKIGNSRSNVPPGIMLDPAGNTFLLIAYKNTAGKYNFSKWDGASWADLGTGTDALDANDYIRSLATDNAGNMYAFGDFTDSSGPYVAKWDGTTWKNMGPWPYAPQPNYGNACVYVDDSNNVFAAGYGLINPDGEYYVAHWTNNGWQELGAPNHKLRSKFQIRTMIKDHIGNFYVAGNLRDANGTFSVAKWDGTNWSSVGVGSTAINSNSPIARLAINASNRLYAVSTNTSNKQYVAMWNDTTWTVVGEAPNNLDMRGHILSFVVDSNTVYVGGYLVMGTSHIAVYGPLPVSNGIHGQLLKSAIVVCPNPTQGAFEITIPLAGNLSGQPVSISLADVLGRQVFKTIALQVSGKSVRTQLPASLCDGNYFLYVDVEGEHYVQKITLAR